MDRFESFFQTTYSQDILKFCRKSEEFGYYFSVQRSALVKFYVLKDILIGGTNDSEFIFYHLEKEIIILKFKIDIKHIRNFCLVHLESALILSCDSRDFFLINIESKKIILKAPAETKEISCLEYIQKTQKVVASSKNILLIYSIPNFIIHTKINIHESRIVSVCLIKNSDCILAYTSSKALVFLSISEGDIYTYYHEEPQDTKALALDNVILNIHFKGIFIPSKLLSLLRKVKVFPDGSTCILFYFPDSNIKYLLIGDSSGYLAKYEGSKNIVKCSAPHKGKIIDLKILKKKQEILTYGLDRLIKVFALRDLLYIKTISDFDGDINYIANIPKQNSIILKQGQKIAIYNKEHKEKYLLANQSDLPDNQDLFCWVLDRGEHLIYGNNSIYFLCLNQKKIVRKLDLHKFPIKSLILLEKSSHFLYLDKESNINFYSHLLEKTDYCFPFESLSHLSMSISKNNKYFLAVKNSSFVHTYSITSIYQRISYTAHTLPVTSLASLKNSAFISGSKDGNLILWDLKKTKISKCIQTESPITSLTPNPSKQILASGHSTGKIILWSFEAFKILHYFSLHVDEIAGLRFLNDNLVSVSKDCSANIISMKNYSHKTLKFSHPVFGLEISPDEKAFAVTYDKFVKLYAINEGKALTFAGHKSLVYSVSFFKHSDKIISGGFNKDLKIWCVKEKKCLSNLLGISCAWVLKVFKDDSLCLSCSWSNLAVIWDLKKQVIMISLNLCSDQIWSVDINEEESVVVFGLNTKIEVRKFNNLLIR